MEHHLNLARVNLKAKTIRSEKMVQQEEVENPGFSPKWDALTAAC